MTIPKTQKDMGNASAVSLVPFEAKCSDCGAKTKNPFYGMREVKVTILGFEGGNEKNSSRTDRFTFCPKCAISFFRMDGALKKERTR